MIRNKNYAVTDPFVGKPKMESLRGSKFIQKPPSDNITKDDFENVIGTFVFELISKLHLTRRLKKTVLTSCKANLYPMHILGPRPKGIKALWLTVTCFS